MSLPHRRAATTAANRERKPLTIPPISLLSPQAQPLPEVRAAGWEQDLGLGDLASALTLSPRYASFVQRVLAVLNTDPETIRWRQAVVTDFRAQPALVRQIRELLPRFSELGAETSMLGNRRRVPLIEVADRVTQLELYVEVAQRLYSALRDAPLRANALIQLREHLKALTEDEAFRALSDELPTLREPLQTLSSITVGINLNPQLQPVSCTLMAINRKPIGEEASLLDRLIGRRTDATDETGIAPLHHVPDNPEYRLLSAIFQDMDRLMMQAAQPLVRALEKYVRVSHHTLHQLEYELAFFIAAVDLAERWRARGIPFCQPDILPLHQRETDITGLASVTLTLRSSGQTPVSSDVRLSAAVDSANNASSGAQSHSTAGRIAILTGPNSGGKTTYIQAVGMAHVMAQAGLFLPAAAARISPVDQLLTHFPRLETRQQGRLAEEAERLRLIFTRATAYSLVLLNESLSSTAFGEALYLAQDMLAGLRAIGSRAIFATHLVELVTRIPEIESAAEGDSTLYSLVAGIQLGADGTPSLTYHIAPGLPLGRSFAQEIARQHGISLEQILAAKQLNAAQTSPPD